MRTPILLGVAVLLLGCGHEKYQTALVSGRITMDGQPLTEAHVSFRPDGDPQTGFAGPGSVATTGPNGEYTLRLVDPDRAGAVVGKHHVAVMLPKEELLNSGSGPGGQAADGGGPAKKVYKMPQRYRTGSALEFEVPPEGTTKADFNLTTP